MLQTLRRVTVEPPDHPAFKVIPMKLPSTTGRVAPGMDVAYRVVFSPDKKEDYHCNLICKTEREQFVIPVHCLGARGTDLLAATVLNCSSFLGFSCRYFFS